ncbi:hypothetical protein F8388_017118 [Cannabis sativa]|uniref:Uncharacterized protein n=1 Tax=Cannabis sativa TaxID=3483 RepID=A0A7J6GCV9_CANSA|nr:hypothetical protein F8388_017118 [Cannabis sativa]
MFVVSLGTGAPKNEAKYNAAIASKWGAFQFHWMYNYGKTPLIDIYNDATCDIVDFNVSTIFNLLIISWKLSIKHPTRTSRIDRTTSDAKTTPYDLDDNLIGDEASIDISSEENMLRLVEVGKKLLEKPISRESSLIAPIGGSEFVASWSRIMGYSEWDFHHIRYLDP